MSEPKRKSSYNESLSQQVFSFLYFVFFCNSVQHYDCSTLRSTTQIKGGYRLALLCTAQVLQGIGVIEGAASYGRIQRHKPRCYLKIGTQLCLVQCGYRNYNYYNFIIKFVVTIKILLTLFLFCEAFSLQQCCATPLRGVGL